MVHWILFSGQEACQWFICHLLAPLPQDCFIMCVFEIVYLLLRISLTPSVSVSFKKDHLNKAGQSLRGQTLEVPEGFRWRLWHCSALSWRNGRAVGKQVVTSDNMKSRRKDIGWPGKETAVRHEVTVPKSPRKQQALTLFGPFSPTCLHVRKCLLALVEARLEIRGWELWTTHFMWVTNRGIPSRT